MSSSDTDPLQLTRQVRELEVQLTRKTLKATAIKAMALSEKARNLSSTSEMTSAKARTALACCNAVLRTKARSVLWWGSIVYYPIIGAGLLLLLGLVASLR